jgi:hypothetical protein
MHHRELRIRHLASTREQVGATVARIEPSWLTATPPRALGDWSPQRILVHMRDAEETAPFATHDGFGKVSFPVRPKR